MATDEKRLRIIRGNVLQVIHTKPVIKEAAKKIESGLLTIEDAVKEYEVSRQTIQQWMRKYSTMKEEDYVRRKISSEIKRQAVQEVEQGVMTSRDAARKYNVDYSTMTVWLRLFSCTPKLNSKQVQEMAAQEQRPSQIIKEENAGLKFSVEQLQLKVEALETMIELAEKQFDIPIRKKSGTKQ